MAIIPPTDLFIMSVYIDPILFSFANQKQLCKIIENCNTAKIHVDQTEYDGKADVLQGLLKFALHSLFLHWGEAC